MTRAIVYVKTDDKYVAHVDQCMDYCQRQGYDFQGLISDDWAAAERMRDAGETTVIIVATAAHLDPERKPRIEVANQPAVTRWETRTHVIRRDAGA